MSSLKDLRNRLKKLESEKVTSVNSNEQHTGEHTGTLDVTGERTSLSLKVQRNGNKPNDWLELIKYMENDCQFASTGARHLYVSNLYADALKNIPDGEKKTLPYAKLLIHCANFRGQHSVDDAREMFQDARYDAKKFAIVHIAAAQFELSLGNKDKAKKILDKAKSQQAEPMSYLTKAFSNLVYGETQLLGELDELAFTDEDNKENAETADSIKDTVELLKKVTGGGYTGPGYLSDHTLELHNRLNAGLVKQRSRLSESSDDSYSQPQKVGTFKPPLHPKSSYRKRHPTPTDRKEEEVISQPISRERNTSDHESDTQHGEHTGHNNTGCLDSVLNKQPHIGHSRSIRKYHSTPDMKKQADITGPSGSSVKGVFARKKMNLGKPMRVPKKSPLTETNHEDHKVAFPQMVSFRRQSESDDDSIRLKPLPEFSPDKPKGHSRAIDDSPIRYHDIGSYRGSIDSDSGIMSQPGTDNLTNQLHSDNKQSTAPQLVDNSKDLQDILEPKYTKSYLEGSLEPKPSQTRTLLDASQLSTKTLINSSLVDGISYSKTLTNNHGSNKIYPENVVNSNKDVQLGASYGEGSFLQTGKGAGNVGFVQQSSNSGTDSGISSDGGSSYVINQQGQEVVVNSQPQVVHGQPPLIQNQPNLIQNQGQIVQGHTHLATSQPNVIQGQSQANLMSQSDPYVGVPQASVISANHPAAIQGQQSYAQVPVTHVQPHHYNVMQTPHQKQHHSMPAYTPMQGGPQVPAVTPIQQGYPQYPQTYPHVMQPQMMTPMQNQQKMLIIKDKCYTVIKLIGKGGYSKVYQVLDQEYNMRAVKCVNMDAADESTIESYKNEIELLQRLQYSRLIIKMFDYEFNENDSMLYVVMEKGERDLATFFRSRMKRGDMSLELLFFYWKEMLQAVQVLHKEGIVHSDLKPPNFLIVSGDLKLIDFGIAKAIQPDMTSVTREQQVGTLNYMSPEAFMDTCGGTQRDEQGRVKPKIKIGVKSDVWSLGCILYYLVYGKTPFQHITNAWMKLQAITNNDVAIEFPQPENFGTMDTTQLVNVIKGCLTRDPKLRPSIEELLDISLWKQNT